MDAVDPAAPKELRDGRYVLLSPLGQGSQGTTWDAVDKREGRAVAVKAFDVRGARAWKDVELAEREARVLSELRHPLLPRYIEHFEQDGVLYLVMEKVHGTPLSALRKTSPPMGEKDLVRFLHDADQALTYLHGRSPPVIHRDLKPSNVIRRTDGSYAFVDFGAVRDRLRPEGGSTVVGTFGYMAPEQFQGRAGPASDVYAVGATALALLTGKEPENLPHKGLTLDVHAALGTGVSPGLQEALVRMVEPDPDKRATRIGPLLDGAVSSRDRPPRRESRPRDWVDTVESAVASSRRLRRSLRREARRARKQARRERRRLRGDSFPFVLHALIGLGLTIARLAVVLTLTVVVPLILTVLSIVFGKGLVRAAQAVRAAGERAGTALDEAEAEVRGDSQRPGEEAKMRVEESSRRVRVGAPPRTETGDQEEPDDEEQEEEHARRRGSRH